MSTTDDVMPDELAAKVSAALDSSDVDSPQIVSSDPKGLFYTPSMMLNTLNTNLSKTGGSCNLKRKLADGSLIDSTQAERDAQDCSAKMRQSAEQIVNLTADEKVMWAEDRRNHGNNSFKAGKFQAAMDVYMTCLCGMASATAAPDVIRKSDEKIALPALLNMAACAFQLGNYNKAVQICTQAYGLESGVGAASSKLRLRRGKAYMKRGDLDDAIQDFRAAMGLAGGASASPDEEVCAQVRREMQKVMGLREKAKENRAGVKKAMEVAMEKSAAKDGESFYEGEKRGAAATKKKTKSGYSSEKTVLTQAPVGVAGEKKKKGLKGVLDVLIVLLVVVLVMVHFMGGGLRINGREL